MGPKESDGVLSGETMYRWMTFAFRVNLFGGYEEFRIEIADIHCIAYTAHPSEILEYPTATQVMYLKVTKIIIIGVCKKILIIKN